MALFYEKMSMEQTIEAALFVSTEPISLEQLCRIAGAEKEQVRSAVEALKKEYENRKSAIEIRSIGEEHYIMQARDEFSAPLLSLVKPAVQHEVLKTLSFIAMKQPITQAETVKARGYRAYAHIKELAAKEFLQAAPKGRTLMLTTTQKFADYFGLSGKDIAQLKRQMAAQLSAIPEENAQQEAAVQENAAEGKTQE